MPFTIDWNDRQIRDALSEPFHQANEVLGRGFQNEITAAKWDWPNPPLKRDIVDSGSAGIRGSYVGRRAGKFTHSHEWNMEYAMAVHEGARYGRNTKWGQIWIAIHGKPEMPGRPWTEAPLQAATLEEAFEKLARRALEGLQ